MSRHTFTQHAQTWILDQDFMPLARVRIVDLTVEYHDLDDCTFTGNILASSEAYNHLSETAERYVAFFRDNIPGAVFCIERDERSFAMNPATGQMERAVKIAGRGNNSFFLWTADIQPEHPGDETQNGQQWSGYKDDVLKQFIRYSAVVGTAYDDPDGATRGIAGLSVAADKSEHPDEVTDFQRSGNLWDTLYNLCDRDNWDVDLTFTVAWNGTDSAVTFEVDTHYQGRGTDKTSDAADPVILSDIYRSIPKGDAYRDAYKYATHGYNALGHVVVARPSITNRMRREVRFDYLSDEAVAAALVQADEERGDTWEYIENDAYELGQGLQQLWVGDTFSRFTDAVATAVRDARCTGVILEYDNDAVGTEHIKIIIDDPKPKNQTKGGKHRPTIEGPEVFLYWGIRDDADAVAVPRALDNTDKLTGTNGITVLKTASDTLTIDGTELAPAAHTHAHTDLTDVTSDQHHAGYIGNLGNTGAGASPDANDKITFLGDGDTYSFNAHDNQVDFTGPWTRADAGSADYYLRQTNYADDIRLQSAADTDEIWLEGSTGKSHFGDDMYIGNAAGVEDVRLSIYDTRAFSGLHAWNSAVGYSKFGTISSGITVIDNEAGASISFQCGGVESLHLHGDLEWASFRNGVSVLGSPNSDGSGAVWTINSDNGNLYLDPAATTTLGNYVYTWPLADLADGDALGVVGISGSSVTLGGIDVSALGYWTRYDYGEIDQAIRPSVDDDSIHTRESITSAVTMRVEGASGKSWFMSDMAVGAVESTPADPSTLFTHGAKLHVIDEARNGAWAQFLHDTNSAQFGVANDGKAFMNTPQATGLSFLTNSVQRGVVKDDGSEWSFEQGIDLKGYAATNSGTEKWFIDSTQGNVWLDSAATTTFGAYTYTWPTSGGAEDDVLTISGLSGTAATLSWDDPSTLPLWGGYWQRNGIILSPTTAGDDVQVGSSIFLDNSTGYIRATRLEIAGAGNYLSATTNFNHVAAGEHIMFVNGASTYVGISTGGVYPKTNNAMTSATAALRWSTVYGVEGNLTGDLTLPTAGKGIVASSNTDGKILMANGTRFVPVTPKVDGWTGEWSTSGYSATYTLNVTNNGGTPLYYTAGGLVTTSSGGNTPLIAPISQHRHHATQNNGSLALTTA